MKVSLINPSRMISGKSIWKKIDRSLPSLGIAYIASPKVVLNLLEEILTLWFDIYIRRG